MTAIILNPGTEPVAEHSRENADRSLANILAQFGGFIESEYLGESRGRYEYVLRANDRECRVEIPGCEPERFEASRPWYSPRMYVDGSSWLRQYGVGFIDRALFGDSDQ